MKNVRFLGFGLLLMLGTTTFVFASDKNLNPLTHDDGVVINGVKWATRNVDAPGTFAATPESPGMFYQWNRKTAWSATGTATGWDNTVPSGTKWSKSNDPSPVGWRVPTLTEIQSLFDTEKVRNEWTSKNGFSGILFTDMATGNQLFFPAAGNLKNGRLFGSRMFAHYWSSKKSNKEDAYSLDCVGVIADINSYDCLYGFTVRSVSE